MNEPKRVLNSHYVARHLSRPWEFTHPKKGDRQLWYYDLDTEAFAIESSRKLLTLDDPLPDALEDFFNKYVETPLARYLQRFQEDRRTTWTEVELRAMKLCILLQAHRTAADANLNVFADGGEDYANALVGAADTQYAFLHVPLRAERLFFPDLGVLAIPLAGAQPALAVPFHPSHLTAMVPRPHEGFMRQVTRLRSDEANFTALSSGLAPCRRVIIPGSLWGRNTEVELRAAIYASRERCRQLCEGFALLNAVRRRIESDITRRA